MPIWVPAGYGAPPFRPARPLRLVDVTEASDAADQGGAPGGLGMRDAGAGMPAAEPRLPAAQGEAGESTGQDQQLLTRMAPATASRSGFFSSLRVVGQVFDGYLVCEQENGLVLIDQHAAHERVMFENLKAAYSSGSVPSQRLLIPVVVEVGQREAALLSERIEELATLGFEVDSFGGASFSVRAVPALLSDCDAATLLRDVAEEIADVGRSRRLAGAAEAVLACLACHSAVRFGQSLSLPQIRALLTAMDSVDFSGHCPHGRPAFIQFARTELERWFKRT
jgi:DNA mismatch repair protein MutL